MGEAKNEARLSRLARMRGGSAKDTLYQYLRLSRYYFIFSFVQCLKVSWRV